MGLSIFDSIAVKLTSALIEGSYIATDFLDGTTVRISKENKEKAKSSKKLSSEEETYGEKLVEEIDIEPVVSKSVTKDKIKKNLARKSVIIDVNEDELVDPDSESTAITIVTDDAEDSSPLFSVKEEETNDDPISNAKLDEIIKNYNYRDKLFAASLLYSCNRISADQIGALINAIDGDKETVKSNIEYVNSIVRFFTGYDFASNPVYEEKEFKLEDGQMQVVRDITGLDLLSGNPVTSQIIEKLRIWAREHDKVIIIFDNSKLDLFQDDAPKSIIKLVEENLGEFIKDYKHKVCKLRSGLIEITIVRDTGKIDSYIVDPGIVIGQGVKVLVQNVNGQDLFVSSHTILRKTFLNKAYAMTLEETKNVLDNENQFYKQQLYTVYDFSNSSKIFKDATREDINVLENKLNMINDIVFNTFGKTCRMRIKNYRSNDAFIVVSDPKCKVPMEEMIKTIIDGLVIKVNGNQIFINLNDENGNNMYNETISLDNIEQQMVEKLKMPVNYVFNQRSIIL